MLIYTASIRHLREICHVYRKHQKVQYCTVFKYLHAYILANLLIGILNNFLHNFSSSFKLNICACTFLQTFAYYLKLIADMLTYSSALVYLRTHILEYLYTCIFAHCTHAYMYALLQDSCICTVCICILVYLYFGILK